jgi:hypothetical protein
LLWAALCGPFGAGTFGPLGADEAVATVAAKAVGRIEAVSALRPQRGHNNEAHSKLAQLWVAKARVVVGLRKTRREEGLPIAEELVLARIVDIQLELSL